jgi:RimJ/RimL family protein N-acetyltransferase
MAFVNTYTPPHDAVVGDLYGPDPWDLNFMFSVPPAIENDVVKLTPFIPRLHADGFWDVAGASDPELYRFIRRSFASKEDFLDWTRIAQKSSEVCMFLVVDKTKPVVAAEGKNLGGAMAGTMSYITTSKANRVRVHRRIPYSLVLTRFLPQSTEIGFVITLKSAQRTHVTSNAVGLLMKYALNLPSDPTFPGLGLRRVQWTCDSGNKPSPRSGSASSSRVPYAGCGSFRRPVRLARRRARMIRRRETDDTTTISVCVGMIGSGRGELLYRTR